LPSLALMRRAFTVIDSFRVTEALRERLDGLPVGTWFVLEGQFEFVAELPNVGASVKIVTPGGQRHLACVSGVEIRHRVAALSFAEAGVADLPRLSVVEWAENEL
jgi:hypothetical protein